MMKKLVLASVGVVWLLSGTGCSPTVKVSPSEKPIVINMNIKIEHDIRVKMDKEVDALINQKSDLF